MWCLIMCIKRGAIESHEPRREGEVARGREKYMSQWREEWELRILFIASLIAQCLLLLFAYVRNFHIPSWLRFSFRLAHIGSDALAIFALATLLNHRRNGPSCSYAPGRGDVELLLVPILLLHLGGQVVITSYKIEDNECSTRYILTSLSKVTIALYVFYKTWSSDDKKLLAAAVLLFMVAIIRCFQKALALKKTSFSALPKPSSSEVNVIDQFEQLLVFIEQAKEGMHRAPRMQIRPRLPVCELFLYFPCSYSDRLVTLIFFWCHDRQSAYRAIEGVLSEMNSLLYTKNIDTIGLYLDFKNASAPNAKLLVVLSSSLIGGKEPAHRDKDARFTMRMIASTLMVEVVYMAVQVTYNYKLSSRIFQHSLIGLFSHTRRPSRLRIIAGWLQCKDSLDSFWHMEPSNSCREIVELVRCHVETGWDEYINDPCSYRMFNDTRGEWTLERNGYLHQLGWSTRRPFDESVVLWHLATDFYIHQTSMSPNNRVSAHHCKVMSNYMAHLLFNNPEMLMPGSKKRLLVTAYEELEVLLEGEMTPRCERDVTRIAFEKWETMSRLRQNIAPSLIGDAWKLAQTLLSVDETKTWGLIQGVWMEMLCFSASRCRGYLHAEALGTGVEFLSYVWVLLVYTGMETFTEKLQRREFHSDDRNESLASGSARASGDVVTPLAAQTESTVDIVLED